jgi:hypothetical protein
MSLQRNRFFYAVPTSSFTVTLGALLSVILLAISAR